MPDPVLALPPVPRRIAWLHFANDFTLDFLTPLLPGVVSVAWIGVMEGVADAVANLLKLVTGRRSDASGRRVPWVRAGYGINAVMRPLACVGIFFSWPLWIVACRIGDRVGKGVRGSATDALVTDWTSDNQRARAFSFIRTMDHCGATCGALAAAGAVYLWSDHLAWLIAALAVPALAMLWWCRGLADVPDLRAKDAPVPGYWPRDPSLRFPLVVLGLAAVGAKIGPLLVLVQVAGLPLEQKGGAWPLWQLCLGWAALGLVQTVAAAFAGLLTERMGARTFLVVGWMVGAALFAGLTCASGPWALAVALGYGVLAGFTEGAEKTWLAGIAPKAERATAFGAMAIVLAVTGLLGNAVCGYGMLHWGAIVFALPAVALGLSAVALVLRRDPVISSPPC